EFRSHRKPELSSGPKPGFDIRFVRGRPFGIDLRVEFVQTLSVTAKFLAVVGSAGAAERRSCPSAGRPTRSRAWPAEERRRQGTGPMPSTTPERGREGRRGGLGQTPRSPTTPRRDK